MSDEAHTKAAMEFWRAAIAKDRGVKVLRAGKKPETATLADFDSYYTNVPSKSADTLLMFEADTAPRVLPVFANEHVPPLRSFFGDDDE